MEQTLGGEAAFLLAEWKMEARLHNRAAGGMGANGVRLKTGSHWQAHIQHASECGSFDPVQLSQSRTLTYILRNHRNKHIILGTYAGDIIRGRFAKYNTYMRRDISKGGGGGGDQ